MQIKIKAENSAFNRKFLDNQLVKEICGQMAYFSGHNPRRKDTEVSFYVYDGDEIIGGAAALIKPTSWLSLEAVFIAEKYRGLDLGSRLIERLETAARKKECFGILSQVSGNQARGFFEKVGFELCGVLKDCPPGETLYFMKKVL